MMESPSSPASRGGEAVKKGPDIDDVVIKEEPGIVPVDGRDPVSGIGGEDRMKTDDVRIKEELIDLDESEFTPGATIFETERSEDTPLETQVTIKCETQDYLEDETEENPYPDLDPEDEEAYRDFLEDSGGPSYQGHISAGAGQFVCYYCGCSYHKKSLLDVHVKAHLQARCCKTSVVPLKKLLCPHCDYRCRVPSRLSNHMTQHREPSLQCPLCPYLAKTEIRLRLHRASHNSRLYKCKRCSYRAPTSDALGYHVRKVHLKWRKQCYFCDFSSPTSVPSHELSKHAGELYQCRKCPQKFANRRNLRIHVFSEHTVIYQCYHCGLKATSKYLVARHIRKLHFPTLNVPTVLPRHRKGPPVLFSMDQL